MNWKLKMSNKSRYMPNKICICGAGTMGRGIAQVAAQCGCSTLVYDISGPLIERGQTKLNQDLQTLVGKGRMSPADCAAIKARVSFTTNIRGCVADIIIEAVVENLEVKKSLFHQLSEINSDRAIFATNTSSLSVTEIARTVRVPARVIGLHFFNPAPVMKLVEIVRTGFTSEETARAAIELAGLMGKTPVLCEDSPGFIVNRVARPYYLESLRLIEEGISDFGMIDALMESSGFKMGPFKLMDLIGNDINYAVSCFVYEALKKPTRLMPSAIQQQRVEKNELGKKTGKGYYLYS
jgi:3-hydroxybutyryl-CoA dehydrogenase